jgi:hypothetical protein
MSSDQTVYVVTDIECDGPWPGRNSLLSFGSVAVRADGTLLGEFEAVLKGLPGAAPDPDTYAWFQTIPEMWAAATTDPRPPADVMADFVTWVRGLPRPRVFAASPVAFDGMWIDYYLRRFADDGAMPGPYEDDPLFDSAGFCIRSAVALATGWPWVDIRASWLPAEWLSDVPHTHRAIDDARGYAHLLVALFSGTVAATSARYPPDAGGGSG